MIVSRQALKGLFFTLLNLTGEERRRLAKTRRGRLLTVLNLHQVSPHANPFYPPLDPRVFEQLLIFLKENFHIALFRELDDVPQDKPTVVLSFDDGYYDFVEYVMPLLDKHGLRANQNVIPSCVVSGLPMWNVRLYDFLNAAPLTLINEINLSGFGGRLAADDRESKVRYGLRISRFLKNRPRREREELLAQIAPAMQKVDRLKLTRMMSTDDVREAARVHEIGAHSFSHESMGYEDDAFFQDDLRQCKDFFGARLGLPLDVYAFPNGSYRDSQVTLLQEAGVKHVLLVGERFAERGRRVYPRFTLYGETFLEVKFLALGYKGQA